jgi:hypothetical protein
VWIPPTPNFRCPDYQLAESCTLQGLSVLPSEGPASGQFLHRTTGADHFAKTGDEPVVVQIKVASAPSSTEYVDATQDPRKSGHIEPSKKAEAEDRPAGLNIDTDQRVHRHRRQNLRHRK